MMRPHRYGSVMHEQAASFVNAHPGRMIFTNDATEASKLAIKDVVALTAQWRQWRRVTG